MDEMEKMEAVKRAYAEMILNTAKEAAERVMAAELRARRTEQELITVKEDAANMLLRLKQMIDAKTKEAEISSLNQKEKFEELESQLNEAEGIILDLREELNQEQDQLDRLKKKQVPLKRQNEENAEECGFTTVVACSSYELLTGPKFNAVGTQKTRATETSLNAVRSASEFEEKNQQGNNSESVSIVRRSVRKRKLKFWGDVIAACGLQSSHLFKKPRQGSADLSCLATHKMKRCVKNGEDLAERRAKIIESRVKEEVSKELTHTESLPENMELIDVLVKQDELAATFELTSASKIDCDVDDGAASNTPNLSCADGNKLCKYTFNRRWRKKSVVYPEKVLDRGS